MSERTCALLQGTPVADGIGIVRPLVAALVLLVLPASASAQKAEQAGIATQLTTRIDRLVGTVPIVGADRAGVQRTRVAGRTWRFRFTRNTTSTGPTWEPTMRILREARDFGQPAGALTDRRLSAADAAVLRVVADLGRDADVLVVRAGHPACAGLNRAQALAIGSRQATRWSQVGLAVEPDTITVRQPALNGPIDEPWLGGPFRRPAGVPPAYDGGLQQTAADPGSATATSWTRARKLPATTFCAVPLDGVAPSDATVRSLQYPEAFPIAYVQPRWKRIHPRSRAIANAFAAWIAGPAARAQLAQRGMLAP